MATHRVGMIGGVQVAGGRYVVYGRRVGVVGKHRTKQGAFRKLADHARERMRLNDPSDAQVYFWRAAVRGWELVGEAAGVELVEDAGPGERSGPPVAVEVRVTVGDGRGEPDTEGARRG